MSLHCFSTKQKLNYLSPVISGFFQWIDKPICSSCNVTSERKGYATPTSEEARWGAGNVENYQCPNCGQYLRFPRYNHPAKLLGEDFLLSHPIYFLSFPFSGTFLFIISLFSFPLSYFLLFFLFSFLPILLFI